MFKQACGLCKVVGVIAILGALNWGFIGIANVNFVEQILGPASRWAYILFGLSGLALSVSYLTVCPACKKS